MVVGRAAGDGDDQVVRVVVRCMKIDVVESVEHDYREPAQALLPSTSGWLTTIDSSSALAFASMSG